MNCDELRLKIKAAEKELTDIVVKFKQETGFCISTIDLKVIDASSCLGPDFIPGNTSITIR